MRWSKMGDEVIISKYAMVEICQPGEELPGGGEPRLNYRWRIAGIGMDQRDRHARMDERSIAKSGQSPVMG